MWQRLAPREKMLLVILSCLAMVAGFYYLVVNGSLPRYLALRQKAGQAEQQLAGLRQTSALQAGLREKRSRLEAEIDRLQRQLGSNPAGGGAYLEVLSRLPAEVQLQGLYPGEIVDAANYVQLPLKLIATGPYQELVQTLELLETTSNYSNIKHLGLKPEGENRLLMEVELDIYGSRAELQASQRLFSDLGKLDVFQPQVPAAPARGANAAAGAGSGQQPGSGQAGGGSAGAPASDRKTPLPAPDHGGESGNNPNPYRDEGPYRFPTKTMAPGT